MQRHGRRFRRDAHPGCVMKRVSGASDRPDCAHPSQQSCLACGMSASLRPGTRIASSARLGGSAVRGRGDGLPDQSDEADEYGDGQRHNEVAAGQDVVTLPVTRAVISPPSIRQRIATLAAIKANPARRLTPP